MTVAPDGHVRALLRMAVALLFALALLAFGVASGKCAALVAGQIWIAHVGFDRMLRFSRKYAAGFRVALLRRIGWDCHAAEATV